MAPSPPLLSSVVASSSAQPTCSQLGNTADDNLNTPFHSDTSSTSPQRPTASSHIDYCYQLANPVDSSAYLRGRRQRFVATATADMRSAVCVRNIFYGLLLFLSLAVLKTYTTLEDKDGADSSQLAVESRLRASYVQHRLKRTILKASELGAARDTLSASATGRQSQRKFTSTNDVFISVKTTHMYHKTRLRTILDTWHQLAPEQIYFFSDSNDAAIEKEIGKTHFINTGCAASHQRQALNCKMEAEIDRYLESTQSWFCHFDDDNYVNVPELRRLLQLYDPKRDWYLGRPSTKGPISIEDNREGTVSFWFATGGAGFCISRSLATKMTPYVSNNKLVALGDSIRLPDDVTIGYLIEHLLNVRLTVVPQFHSHLESMRQQRRTALARQISLSAGGYDASAAVGNTVPLDDDRRFTAESDPSRFRALHCYLFPSTRPLCAERNATVR